MTDPRFPGAPPDSYICKEGWLIIGDEAWTEEEWRSNHGYFFRKEYAVQRSQRRRLKNAERIKRWRERNQETVRAYNRERMCHYRAEKRGEAA